VTRENYYSILRQTMAAEFQLYDKAWQNPYFRLLHDDISDALREANFYFYLQNYPGLNQVKILITGIDMTTHDPDVILQAFAYTYSSISLSNELGEQQAILIDANEIVPFLDAKEANLILGAGKCIVDALLTERCSDGLTAQQYETLKTNFIGSAK